jgi:hypothetical protein
MKGKKPMSHPKINMFLKTYNKTIHQTTGVSQWQMNHNKELKKEYIIDLISQQNKLEKTNF